MRDVDEREAPSSAARVLRVALLSLAGAAVLTAIGLLTQTSPAHADERPAPPSLLGSVTQGVGSLLGGGSDSGGLVGSIVTPVTGAVDSTVTSLPVVGTVTSGLLGTTPTGSITAPVVGAVDQVVGGVTGIVSGGGGDTGTPPTSPGDGGGSAPGIPSTGSGTGTGGGSDAATAGAVDPAAVVPAPPAAASTATAPVAASDSAGEPAAFHAPAQPPVAPTASADPAPTAPAPGPVSDAPASTGGALGSSGSSGSGPTADVDGAWTPPSAPAALRPSPPSLIPRSAPPGDHEVSPG